MKVGRYRYVWITMFLCVAATFIVTPLYAQERLPHDTGIFGYHVAPRYRESESHPLRIMAYLFNPIGWVLREGVFRPISYFAGSTETTKSIFGYREPFDYRHPSCFSADDSIPDCSLTAPFNYGNGNGDMHTDEIDNMETSLNEEVHIFFPDVNFDFNSARLNTLGEGKVRQIADLLTQVSDATIILEGHTDYIGSDEYNEKLGLRRAETVKQRLAELGIDPERMSTISFGESAPLYDDKADWARALNRRVAVRIGS